MTPKTKEEIAALRKAFILERCRQSSLNADTLYFYEEAIRLAEARYPLPLEEKEEPEYRIYTDGDMRYRYAGSVLECKYKGGAWEPVLAIEARDILALADLIAHPLVEKKGKKLRQVQHNGSTYQFNPESERWEMLRNDGEWMLSQDFQKKYAPKGMNDVLERIAHEQSRLAVYALADRPYEETE